MRRSATWTRTEVADILAEAADFDTSNPWELETDAHAETFTVIQVDG